jgi:hypothetical protein
VIAAPPLAATASTVTDDNSKEIKMDKIQTINRSYEQLAWGAIFVWWGITELFHSLPNGTGALGLGVILIGLNVARSLNGLPTNGFSVTLGILAVVWGGLDLAGALLGLPFELPVFAILLIVLGGIVLLRELGGQASRVQEA